MASVASVVTDFGTTIEVRLVLLKALLQISLNVLGNMTLVNM